MDVYDAKFVPAPHGMHNTGAICYWNALIQSLVSLPTFNRVLLANEAALAKNGVATQLITYIKGVLESNSNDITVNTTRFAKSSTMILTALIQQLRRGRRHTDLQFGQRQESASEGFVLLIDMLKMNEIEHVFNNRYRLSSWCPSCDKEIMIVNDHSFQINLFSRERPQNADDFAKLVRTHTNIHEDYKCEECGETTKEGVRFHVLKMLREVMVIEFNKYMVKDLRWFPEQMRFKSTNDKYLTYKLISVIEHSGGLNGGHYWCRAYRPTSETEGKFYNFNDMSVKEDGPQPTPNSYMLFYHLWDDGNAIADNDAAAAADAATAN